jgi:hypothetical protein
VKFSCRGETWIGRFQYDRTCDPFAWIVLHFAMARRALAHIALRGGESGHLCKLNRRRGKQQKTNAAAQNVSAAARAVMRRQERHFSGAAHPFKTIS